MLEVRVEMSELNVNWCLALLCSSFWVLSICISHTGQMIFQFSFKNSFYLARCSMFCAQEIWLANRSVITPAFLSLMDFVIGWRILAHSSSNCSYWSRRLGHWQGFAYFCYPFHVSLQESLTCQTRRLLRLVIFLLAWYTGTRFM